MTQSHYLATLISTNLIFIGERVAYLKGETAMKYHLNFSYENVIVPMNAQTAAAIETLFGKSIAYDETWNNSQEGFVEKHREFRI